MPSRLAMILNFFHTLISSFLAYYHDALIPYSRRKPPTINRMEMINIFFFNMNSSYLMSMYDFYHMSS